jgi:hypothetical protein
VREPVEQRRLAHVRIADQRHKRLRTVASASRRTRAAHVVELFAQQRHTSLNLPAIDFEFRFAGAARSDAAPEPRESGARTDQVGLAMAQLRELHLQLAFAAARALCKNIQDDHRAIDDR